MSAAVLLAILDMCNWYENFYDNTFIFRDFLNCLRSFCTHYIIVISLLSFIIAMTASELSSYQKISICPYHFEEDWCRVAQAIPEIPSSYSKLCQCFPSFLISVFLPFHILWLWLKHELKTRGFILQGIWRRPVITELIMQNLKSQVMKLFLRPRTLMKIILYFSGDHHFFLITGDKVSLWPR